MTPTDRELIERCGITATFRPGMVAMATSELSRLIDAVRADERSKDWMPIETAPRDGTQVLVVALYPHGHAYSDVRHAWWDKFLDDCEGGWSRWPHKFNPTLWRPLDLPPPPSDRKEQDDVG